MNKERLKEIKDSIDFQLSVCNLEEYEVSKLLAEEEKELYDEVIRLNNIINKLEKWLLIEISIHCEDDTIDTLYNGVLDKLKELEKENKNLKEDFKRHIDRINELTNRIDKAIELLERYNDRENNYYVPVMETIDILKGDDKE